jgi:hypothetical protein
LLHGAYLPIGTKQWICNDLLSKNRWLGRLEKRETERILRVVALGAICYDKIISAVVLRV